MSGREPTAGRVVQADGRSKAYRPLAQDERATAVRAGLEAYERGDFFLAHELLEPAWMGTDDPAERALVQGLIKLAAADVHAVRGNAHGVIRNLEGAQQRIELAAAAGAEAPGETALDVTALAGELGARLVAARRGESTGPLTVRWRA